MNREKLKEVLEKVKEHNEKAKMDIMGMFKPEFNLQEVIEILLEPDEKK
jgi:hypothetical protein